jgi:hypothetical protein
MQKVQRPWAFYQDVSAWTGCISIVLAIARRQQHKSMFRWLLVYTIHTTALSVSDSPIFVDKRHSISASLYQHSQSDDASDAETGMTALINVAGLTTAYKNV